MVHTPASIQTRMENAIQVSILASLQAVTIPDLLTEKYSLSAVFQDQLDFLHAVFQLCIGTHL